MKVKMINSVGEYVAGEEYDLDADTIERFVILGYAEGTITDPTVDVGSGHQLLILGQEEHRVVPYGE